MFYSTNIVFLFNKNKCFFLFYILIYKRKKIKNMAITNNLGQTRVGVRSQLTSTLSSSLLSSLYSVYNADSVGLSSLKTSLYASYNGESNTNDSFGSNNGTAVGGLTYATGKIGQAFNFNGTNAYVSLSNSSGQFNFTGDFTISTWINIPNYTKHLALFENYVNGGTYGYGYSFNLQTHNKFQIMLRNGNVASQYVSASGISTASWHHIVVVRKVGQAAKFYINGVLIFGNYALGNSSMAPVYSGSNPCTMGFVTYGTTAHYSNHRQDATTIWNRELTASEITELYNSGNGAQYIGDDFYKPTTNDALLVNNGTAQGGLTYGPGKIGTAFQFNGTNAYVSLLRTTNQFDFTGSFSISVWIKPTASSANYKIFQNFYGTTVLNRYGYNLYLQNGLVRFATYANNTNIANSSQAIIGNTWYHITITKTVSNAFKMYINGVLQTLIITDGNISNNPTYNALNQVNIGSTFNNNSRGDYFNGQIDALNTWTKELTTTEITELYNAGNGKQYPF
jgi:hypothetical protein